jgi:hypothetical protein
LRDTLHRFQAIQPCHQRVVQRGGNGQRWQGPGQRIAVLPLLEQAGFQDHFGQLFDKERHPIGLGHDLLDHLGGQGLPMGDLADHLGGLGAGQPSDRDLGAVGAPGPGWGEVGPKGAQGQDAGSGSLIDQQAEQLQCGGIDPVQVFHHQEHRLLGRNAQEDGQQGVQRVLLLLLGSEGQGGIVGRQGEGEQGSKEGEGLCEREAILHQKPLELAQLLRRWLLPLEAQRHPLQQVDPGIQSGMLVIGRTLARRQPRLRLSGDLLCQHLHQARFADARFAAEQHHLPAAVFDLRPALPQQPNVLLPTHEGGEPSAAGRFQATARHALIEHPIDRQRLG